MNQYAIIRDNQYLKANGKSTNSLERAYLIPTKKAARQFAADNGGEIVEIFLSETPIKSPIDCVYLVKRTCPVMGLTTYGPFFTEKEAVEIYDSVINASKTIENSLFTFEQTISYSLYGNGNMREASNKLGDTLTITKIMRF